MHHRGAQRILGGGARAAAADRLLHRRAVELDVLADDDVVDRDAGVLAQQVLPLLGDRDVLDHGVEHGAAGGVGLRRHQPLEAALDVRRQELDRADVERLGDLFDFLRIELHAQGSWKQASYNMRTTPEAIRNKPQHLPEALLVEPAIEIPADPGAERQRRQRQHQQYQPGAVERHRAERGEGRDVNRHDERLIEGARLVLRPAAKLRPDRRQHAGIAAEAAQDAGDEADRDVGAAAGDDVRQPRRDQRIDAVDGEEGAERDLQRADVGAHQQPDADRHAEHAGQQERPEPPPIERATQRPDRAELHRKPAGDDQERRVDRRDGMQPDRRRRRCRRQSLPRPTRAPPRNAPPHSTASVVQRQRGEDFRPH